jgi:hypothetical protein
MTRLGFGISGPLKGTTNDKRRMSRRGCDMNAWIRQEYFGFYECRVLDLSQNGVRLTAMPARTIPNSFVLLLAKDGIEQPARVKWRRGAQIGAEFSAR